MRKVKNGLSLAELSEELRNDFDIAQEAVRRDWREMNFLSENLQKKLYNLANYYFSIEVAVKHEAFKEASNVLKQNRALTLQLVAEDGMLLEYALPEFQDDFEIVMTAVKESWEAIAFASDYLQVDYYIYYAMKKKCIETLEEDGLMLKYVPKAHISENIALTAVENNGLALQYVPTYMKVAYKNLTKEALRNNGLALQFATEEMQNDEKIVLLALANDRDAIEFASPSLQADIKLNRDEWDRAIEKCKRKYITRLSE